MMSLVRAQQGEPQEDLKTLRFQVFLYKETFAVKKKVKVLIKGTGVINDAGNIVYTYVINKQTVEVTTRVVDGVTQIVDAWVKTR